MRYIVDDRFLTVREVAEILQLSILTIYKYIKQNEIEAVQFGGHFRIKQSSLEKFIKQHALKRTSDPKKNSESLKITYEK